MMRRKKQGNFNNKEQYYSWQKNKAVVNVVVGPTYIGPVSENAWFNVDGVRFFWTNNISRQPATTSQAWWELVINLIYVFTTISSDRFKESKSDMEIISLNHDSLQPSAALHQKTPK